MWTGAFLTNHVQTEEGTASEKQLRGAGEPWEGAAGAAKLGPELNETRQCFPLASPHAVPPKGTDFCFHVL